MTRSITFAAVLVLVIAAGMCSGLRAGEDSAPIRWDREAGRWSADRAKAWYARQGWLAGANFVPSTASNQLEMWQAETWDPETIDEELGWAAGIGFNVMRVYLHDMLWAADAEGFAGRIDAYLAIADKHGIKTMLVLLDSVWDPFPALGPQPEPVPHVHNSRWVQSPHLDIQKDPSRYDELKPYVVGVLTRFKDDPRVLAWDLFNEPGNPVPQYQPQEGWSREEKERAHLVLLDKLFDWARMVDPSQPVTAGVWVAVGRRTTPIDPLDRLMLERSDIITFHTYEPLPAARTAVEWLQESGRPIICTEYLSRGTGCTFQTVMPYFKQQHVGAINWGLVAGRSQTIYPWDSWNRKYTAEPDPWFHDVFRPDGTPYSEEEAELIRAVTARESAGPIEETRQSGGFRWDTRAGVVALLRNDAVIWQFNYGVDQPKPFFHPLAVPGGPVLTVDRPADHPWHHGLWFAWKYINGINYWEPAPGASLPEGRTEWVDVQVETRADFSARIVMEIRYRPAGGDSVMTEHRVVEISPPDTQGVFHQDWTLAFTATGGDVVLSRTPIPGEPEGVAWGGYAGLSVRFANELADVRAVTSQGPIDLSAGTYRGRAAAMDYSGVIEQREVGIAILDHPDNLNSPSPWYAIRDDTMRYFSPAVLCFGPHTLEAGQTLCLRYRVLMHPGRWDAETLRGAFENYR
jgi:hypothetical protein